MHETNYKSNEVVGKMISLRGDYLDIRNETKIKIILIGRKAIQYI